MSSKKPAVVEAVDRTVIEVDGADAASWLNGLVTCDVAKIAKGEAAYGLIVNTKGRILADVHVAERAGGLSLVVPSSELESLLVYLNHYLVMEDVVLETSAKKVAYLLFDEGDDASLPKVSFLGETARLFIGPREELEKLADGRAKLSPVEIEALRLRRAAPKYGVDFGGDTYPQEAGLEKNAVSFNKGCYLGQEVVCMLELRGQVRRKLALLRVAGDALPEKGVEVSSAGTKLGVITSSAATDAGTLAIAMIKVSSAEPGTVLDVSGRAAEVIQPVA